MLHSTHFEYELWLDDEIGYVEVVVHCTVDTNTHEFQLDDVDRADDGSTLILTSEQELEIINWLSTKTYDMVQDAEDAYADYKYEQYRDDKMMEDWQ